MKRRACAVWIAALVVLAAASFACRRKGDPVRETVERVARLAEKGDPDGIGKLLSESYRDASGQGREDALLMLRRTLAGYESLSVRLSGLTTEKRPDLARATFVATLSGTPRKAFGLDSILPRSSRWRFEVNLAREGSAWKVSWVSWEEAAAGAP